MAPRLIVLDPLSRIHEPDTKTLRSFFFDEFRSKKGTSPAISEKDFRREQVLTPQQRNGHDCGVFVMQYVERLVLQDFHLFFELVLPSLATWFSPAEIAEKRLSIAALIVNRGEAKLAEQRSSRPDSSSTLHATGRQHWPSEHWPSEQTLLAAQNWPLKGSG